ncbi:transporter substrate-binding domain-containing protein [Halalkalibacterium halodurans]|uniref:transporter substrate-binding domain-containing protein n=2 Tax=Halalkalibacterium halodurans TaxID=86665 RepID=UPI0010674080|nr:transporter substrate-binding domain-containing protein [Halalkalibacterium halodurans]TES55004.1 transporter substrate-binding domain-containing protein [Halalkalibacterium halodurans]
MKKIKNWMQLGVTSILAVGLLAACGTAEDTPEEATTGADDVEAEAGDEEKTVLVMGTSADYPPYESVDVTTGEIVGFDVDIAEYITSELGYELKIQDMDFNGIIPALQAGRVDFALSGMTPTEERKKSVDFSDVYYDAQNLVVFKEEDGLSSVEDLAGKTVGVQLASIQEEAAVELQEELDGLTIETRNRVPELVQELLAGRFDALIIEDTVAAGHLEANPGLVSFAIESEGETGSAIAFPKDSELTEPFNEKLQEMMEDGTMEELILKWFGGEEQ